MSMQDPLSDMLVRIKNAQSRFKSKVLMPSSSTKKAIAEVLQAEGYIETYDVVTENKSYQQLSIKLKYFQGKPVIEKMNRISRPGLRVYKGADEIPSYFNGLGVMIVSTPKGIMTGYKAKKERVGGELLCAVF